ncbi:MAG TPA: hypothetical protein VK395_18010 [Gemmataceae bacterium]|nr:hypothetical protein [Gemmataceae bacterium]
MLRCAVSLALVLLMQLPSALWSQEPAPGIRPGAAQRHTPRPSDALPDGAILRLGTSRYRAPLGVYRGGLSTDGKLLAILDNSGLLIFDLATGESRRLQEAHDHSGFKEIWSGLALSADNKEVFITTSRDSLCGIDVETGKLVRELDAEGKPALTSSPYVFMPQNGWRQVWPLAAGRGLVGETSRSEIVIFDPTSEKIVQRFPVTGQLASVAADGNCLAVLHSQPSEIVLFDFKGKELRRVHHDSIIRTALGPKGHVLITINKVREIRVWATESGKGLHVLRMPGSNVDGPAPSVLAVSQDEKNLFVGTQTGEILRWNLTTGQELPPLVGHSYEVTGLYLSTNGQTLVSTAWDCMVRQWNLATGKPLSGSEEGYHGNLRIARSPDGRTIALCDGGGRLETWSAVSRQRLRILRQSGPSCSNLAFSPDGKRLAVGQADFTIRILNVEDGREQHKIDLALKPPRSYSELYGLLFSPDGRFLLTSESGVGTSLLEATTGKEIWHLGDYLDTAFSPDGKILFTADVNQRLVIRNSATGQALHTVTMEKNSSWIAFAPDGSNLATCHADGSIELRDPRTLRRQKTLRGHIGEVFRAEFSASGKWLASCGDKTVRIWEVASGAQVLCLNGHTGHVNQALLAPDSRTILSCAGDSTAILWRTRPVPEKGPAPSLEALWNQLDDEPTKAYAAIWSLTDNPKASAAFLRSKIAPLKIDGERSLQKLVADLDSKSEPEREAASRALAELGSAAEAVLREALESSKSREVRRRITKLLDGLSQATPVDLRRTRAVQALELCGTAEAEEVLRQWSEGSEEILLTRDARAALQRIRKETPAPSGPQSAPLPAQQDGRDLQPKTKARVDLYGDLLPEHAVARLGTTRFRDTALALTPHGKILVVLAGNGALSLCDAATGREIHRLSEALSTPVEAALSPDGKLLVVGTDSTIFVWEMASGRRLLVLDDFQDRVNSMALSPDGSTLAVGLGLRSAVGQGAGQAIRLLAIPSGKVLREFGQQPDSSIHSLAFSPDGKNLAVESVALRPDGNFKGPCTLQLWDPSTGKQRGVLGEPHESCRKVAFSPKGDLLATVENNTPHDGGTVRILQVATGRLLHQWSVEARHLVLAFAPEGKLLAAGGWGDTRVWDPASGKEILRFPFGVDSLLFSADGRFLITSSSLVRFWQTSTWKEARKIAGHQETVSCLAFAPDGGTIATGSWDRTVRLWDASSGQELACLETNEGGFRSLAFSKDGNLLATGGGRNDGICIWDWRGRRLIRRLDKPSLDFDGLAFTPDSKTLASLGINDGKVYLWDLATGKALPNWNGRAIGTSGLAVSTDGRWLATKYDMGLTRLWDLASGKLIREAGEEPNMSNQGRILAFSPDGRMLAVGGQELALLEVASGQTRWKLASGSLRLEVASGQTRWKLASGFHRPISALAFSPNSRLLAVGSEDADVLIQDVLCNEEIGRLKGHYRRVGAVAFSPDGKKLASGGGDMTSLVWDASQFKPAGLPTTVNLNNALLESLWAKLAEKDGQKAFEAMSVLVGGQDSPVPFLRRKLQRGSGTRIAQLLVDLDSDRFAVRDTAAQELELYADAAESALRRALAEHSSPEIKRRIVDLLDALKPPPPPPEPELRWGGRQVPDPAKLIRPEGSILSQRTLRIMRAVEVLENIGSQEARKALKTLADGDPDLLWTQDAGASLRRLDKRARGN